MKIPKNALIAVVDGEKLNLYHNSGDEHAPNLTALPDADVSTENMGSGGRHQSSSANPSDSQQNEDSFAAGVSEVLNKRATSGNIDHLIVIAAPRTLGELRKHYHKALEAKLVGEISKDLTGHTVRHIEEVVAAA
ncbi:host attachment family protein [Sphingomonas sp. S2-65]|uniref:host attachment family protein n=1 Tax=Sphingomonas sp. S2-65 TaxID=2903960 RepID=UPI001F33F7AD|nr:host attachment protein [Sphingomonas sp. S2-65]UYY57140.1 host attachment protein [Sphingomonas sp. S2-65]